MEGLSKESPLYAFVMLSEYGSVELRKALRHGEKIAEIKGFSNPNTIDHAWDSSYSSCLFSVHQTGCKSVLEV